MAENLSVEAPDFQRIEKEAGDATADATRTTWLVLNATMSDFRRNNRIAQELLEPKAKTDAPGASQNNYPTNGSSCLHFTGAGAFNLTGVQAPEPGKARLLIIHVSGAGTVTLMNESASSIAENRIHTSTGADVTCVQDQSRVLIYLSNRWRQVV